MMLNFIWHMHTHMLTAHAMVTWLWVCTCRNCTNGQSWVQKAFEALQWRAAKRSRRAVKDQWTAHPLEKKRWERIKEEGVGVKRCWMRRGSRSSEGAVGSPRPAAAAGSWTRANRLGQQGALICHQQFLHVWPAYPAWGLVPGRVCSPSRHCQKMMCHYKKKKIESPGKVPCMQLVPTYCFLGFYPSSIHST